MKLGQLSDKYESGGDPGCVSSGSGDPGGVSYGKWQMIASNAKFFIFSSTPGAPYKDQFAGLTPGTVNFSNKWKEVAKKDPEGFTEAQRKFIELTHYLPTLNLIEKELGLLYIRVRDSFALQNVVWSCAVQFGSRRAVYLLEEALGGVNFNHSVTSNEDIIRRIYAERGAMSGNKLKHFSHVGDKLIPGLRHRFESEMNDAIKLVRMETAPTN